jgi:subtilisin family serine protease
LVGWEGHPPKALAITALLLCVMAAHVGDAPEAGAAQRGDTHRYVVLLPSAPHVARAESLAHTTALRRFTALHGFTALLPERAAEELRRMDGAIVARDATATLSATQLDPPWGLDRLDQEGGTPDFTYTYRTTGRGVDAYVIDSGIAADHHDFGDRVTAGFSAVGGSARTDCGGHGTHVAGTLGGTRYGVAKEVTLVPVKVFGCGGTTDISVIIEGIDFVLRDHQAGTPAVANISAGAASNAALNAAVAALVSDGVTVVAAAGNEAEDACATSPANVAAVITTGASNPADAPAWFSNWGSCVDLFAPGTDVLSAEHTSTDGAVAHDGTSMAAPHVTGAAARYLSAVPDARPSQVHTALVSAALDGAVTATAETTAPTRLLNVPGRAPVALDGAVSNAEVSPGDSVTVTGHLRNDASGAAIVGSDVVLQARTSPGDAWRTVAIAATSSTGRVRFTRSPRRTLEYRLRHWPTTWTRGASSSPRRVTVVKHLSTLTLTTSSATVAAGERFVLHGALLDATNQSVLAGKTVYLKERRIGETAWEAAGRWTTDGSGGVRIARRTARTKDYRLHFGGSATVSGCRSVPVRVRVRG